MSFVHDIGELVAESATGLLAAAPHWERVPLRQVAKVVNGYPFPSGGFNSERGEPVIRIRDILPGKTTSRFDGDASEAPVASHGDLVIGMDGDFNCRLWPGEPALLNQRVCKLEVDERAYSTRLLAYVLPAYLKLINDNTSAVTVKHLSSGTVQDIPLPVPPRSEQDRLVSRLDELFSEIDEGERALERVGQLVERYRQSVLKAAVTGELTREWRTAHVSGAAARSSAEIATDTLGEVPAAWRKCRVDEAGEVQLGRQRSPDNHQGDHMRPYLRVANVFEERIDTSDVMSMNFTPDEYARFKLEAGDIFLNEGQSKELVGRPAMYRGELPGGCFTNSLVRFRCRPGLMPEFAMCVFLYFMKSGHFQRIAKVTTNIAHLGAGRFAEMAFPLPPLDEQRVIVDRVAAQASVWQVMRDDVSNRRKHAQALRQSILKAAFSGQLVPQDPADEPASSLLARLAAQAADAPATPRRRGRPAGRRSSQPHPEAAD